MPRQTKLQRIMDIISIITLILGAITLSVAVISLIRDIAKGKRADIFINVERTPSGSYIVTITNLGKQEAQYLTCKILNCQHIDVSFKSHGQNPCPSLSPGKSIILDVSSKDISAVAAILQISWEDKARNPHHVKEVSLTFHPMQESSQNPR